MYSSTCVATGVVLKTAKRRQGFRYHTSCISFCKFLARPCKIAAFGFVSGGFGDLLKPIARNDANIHQKIMNNGTCRI